MILQLADRYRKTTACILASVLYTQTVMAAYAGTVKGGDGTGYMATTSVAKKLRKRWQAAAFSQPALLPVRTVATDASSQNGIVKQPPAKQPYQPLLNSSGPSQPEMQAFTPVNSSNMVDLFSGDFSYNIPLMDVGGYPINIGYKSGISMDEEASWVGLGWNINPGTITRNMRGIPDDFKGNTDTIRKTTHVKDNKTVGASIGSNFELFGFADAKFAQPSFGIFHNNQTGWGAEVGLDVSINAGAKAAGALSGGLSLTDNSATGVTFTPRMSVNLFHYTTEDQHEYSSQLGSSFSFNSRSGIRGLQLSLNGSVKAVGHEVKSDDYLGDRLSGNITFAMPSFTPTVHMPYTSTNYTYKFQIGEEVHGGFPATYLRGYTSTQSIKPADVTLTLPAYGYLHYQDANGNRAALLDQNRAKEIPYRESPQIPNLAVPSYTYDVYSMTGEGTGGTFRPYRGDIGFVYDHAIKTKDNSLSFSGEVGLGSIVHVGADITVNRAYTQYGPWLNNNRMADTIPFRNSYGLFEAAYFRNPAEKAINSTTFYKAIGGEDVVTVNLQQNGSGDANITATGSLNRYQGGRYIDNLPLTQANSVKATRDKRTQVISYLTAEEASLTGLSRYIDIYTPNTFNFGGCGNVPPDVKTDPGLWGDYFTESLHHGNEVKRIDPVLNFAKPDLQPLPGWSQDHFTAQWDGLLYAPVNGAYQLNVHADDAMVLYLNDSLVVPDNNAHDAYATINLAGGVYYKMHAEFAQNTGDAFAAFKWKLPGATGDFVPVPPKYLFQPDTSHYYVLDAMRAKEKRVYGFRKANHISEIDVTNTDGRRYVYGIPVYNLVQRDVNFSVNHNNGNRLTNLVSYTNGVDNTVNNTLGKENYFSSEEVPAYAHSFLLTGILSPDYVDLTGNGISDDDPGDAIKFNYSRICGLGNTFKWRAPFSTGAMYNEGMKTDNSDDKGSYTYGEKELWYMHSIESKNMIATFTLEDRLDGLSIDESGVKSTRGAQRLKQIDLYTKADIIKNGLAKATPVKTVHFSYSYRLCKGYNSGVSDSGKLTLESIWFTYNGNNKGRLNPYIFTYHSNNPSYNIASSDRWGTYKDAAQNPGSVTGNSIPNAEYPFSIQDSATAAYNAGAWTLNAIKLPSGGSIKVDYESDDYAYVQNKRAMNLFNVIGCSVNQGGTMSNALYDITGRDALYVYVRVPSPVSSKQDVYTKYLQDVDQLYFRMNVAMPSDSYGSGSEYVSGYADIDKSYYDRISDNVICLRLAGDASMATTAINFLRLNLPSKAYPGSDFDDGISIANAVQVIVNMFTNIVNSFSSFTKVAKSHSWAMYFDTSRSMVRLNNPYFKKYGGGLRVKRVTISDNWNAMTKQKESTYGQEYTYTTTETINGQPTLISSGVASYEPQVGGDENPFHVPLDYETKAAPLAPSSIGYVEQPLGEAFFPGASVGYSKVRVRTIHAQNARSANGYEESTFYTAKDFPVLSDMTQLDGQNKKRYKPTLASFLKINAKYFLGVSQGFKVELNDMHGKPRSQATYAETDATNPISYSETFYKTDNQQLATKHLSNIVSVVNAAGQIDTAATIGEDIELMTDMREEQSVTNSDQIPMNVDVFPVGVFPFPFISVYDLPQREENLFHSAAATKVVQRYGLVDSVVAIDKGSRVVTRNLLYNSETGDVILSKVQNEFNDPVYSFSYPADWAYDGMGGAYKNINAMANSLLVKGGKIVGGMPPGLDTVLFASGDEILAYSKPGVARTKDTCQDAYAAFPVNIRLWAVNTNELTGGPKNIYLINQDGTPFSGFDVSLKVMRSGRRNMAAAAGSVTSLQNPVVKSGNQYVLKFDASTKVINAGSSEYRELWQVTQPHKQKTVRNCVPVAIPDCSDGNCNCSCLTPLFAYLLASGNLYINRYDSIPVDTIISRANKAGYTVSASCPILAANLGKLFYATTFEAEAPNYQAQIGDCLVSLDMNGDWYPFTSLVTAACTDQGKVNFKYPYSSNLVTKRIYMKQSMEHFFTNQDAVMKLRSGTVTGSQPMNISTYFQFDTLPKSFAVADSVKSATIHLFAARDGFNPPYITAASSPTRYYDAVNMRLAVPGFKWDKNTTNDNMNSWFDLTSGAIRPDNSFYNFTTDVTGAVKQQYFASDSGNTGFSIINDLACQPVVFQHFVSFASNLYPDLLAQPYIDVTYNTPHNPDEIVATLKVVSCTNCDNTSSLVCYNPVMDTTINPYVYGLLGVYRSNKSYVYFDQRAETDPASATNIRVNGSYKSFAPFWNFNGNGITAQYDTTRWVWNAELTKFNTKGYEVENKDPLGRYNAGLYGYNITLPTAVVQNARYNEAAFEGFEDYDFDQGSCETACPPNRHFDFTYLKGKITGAQSHTGRYSIAVNPNDAVGVSALVYKADTTAALGLTAETYTTACSLSGPVLSGMHAKGGVLLPVFSPLQGTKIVVSAWSREAPGNIYKTYTQSQIGISFTVNGTSQSQALLPSGNIIEGWQRYEGIIDVPANATDFSINLMATGTTTVYFDDIRIHPYNANMKSFVYDPVTLRLVAELDENNYATFYEYDDDGTLIRVKKETERGIKTIKESRSALLKQELSN